MAFVAYNEPDGHGEFFCSGTVIAPNVVLTAGHCGADPTTGAPEDPQQYAVVTGSLDWTDAAIRQVSAVSEVILDPDFDPATLEYDAALLVLSTPTTAPSIGLATGPADLPLLQPGTNTEIAGWGATETEPLATWLQSGQTVLQSPGYCATEEAIAGGAFNEEDQLCALDSPNLSDATCNGDSGGPLLAQNAADDWVEIGITSFGISSDCNTGYPDFFTRADAISSWAAGEIAAVAPAPPPPPPTVTTTATAPAPATTTTTTTASPASRTTASSTRLAPLAGLYRGRTSQHQRMRLRLSPAGLTSLAFGFALACSRGRAPDATLRPIPRGSAWRLNTAGGLGFSRTFGGAGGMRYRISGTFWTNGTVAGSLTITRTSRRHGSCSSGRIRWSATASRA